MKHNVETISVSWLGGDEDDGAIGAALQTFRSGGLHLTLMGEPAIMRKFAERILDRVRMHQPADPAQTAVEL